jgi:hypothetical protein
MRVPFLYSLIAIKSIFCKVLVAHAYNPSYSGGRDQEDGSSKSAGANNLQDSILKKPFTKKKGELVE